ncbi:MAG: hypothetical protein MPEBLZ_03142 [Candidatus Methanoperedens nitroreducens]|uniref:Uncharacterized protein n=1 Tax=Candidatus Methanoperedens nitratireducens TaxID=1392998 RepID=A0A0P8A2L1_9EURY|nr:MAG: hypothetical protein MPEBLZ_03142 [Candidatus Methanoperedens sp. BLZ1]
MAVDIRSSQIGSDLFYEALIKSYVVSHSFVERPWLAKRIETALSDPNCRFLLLTAEPGAGKTAFMAWLANQHLDWPRYFIRRDSQTPLGSGDAHSFLFAIGHQLAALYPEIFNPDKLEIVIEQRIDTLEAGGRVVGMTIEELQVSPFYETSLKVKQDVKIAAGDLKGISVSKIVAEERFLEVGNLQYLALLDPAEVLLKEKPNARIVILIDAMDELRYFPSRDNILRWLISCPLLSPNIRIVITSRPEELLNILRQSKKEWLKEETIDTRSDEVQADLRRYTEQFISQGLVKQLLAGYERDEFVTLAVMRADGNFQYLAALLRGIEQTIEQDRKEQLKQLLRFENVPVGLENLYSFFLMQIKNSVSGEVIEILGDTPFEVRHVEAWKELYQPILGILAVAREPLDALQIKGFSGFQGEDRYLHAALEMLGQFLDHLYSSYRLYHSTFAEFLMSEKTQIAYPICYLEPAEWHRKITAYYRGKAKTWDNVDWSRVDNYGLLHLASHLYSLKEVKVKDVKVYRLELYGLICRSFMQEKLKRFGSHQSFAADVELAIEAARSEKPYDYVQEVRGVLIYATLGLLSTNVPPEAVGVLAAVGQVDKAEGYSALIRSKSLQARAYHLIGKVLIDQKEVKKAREVLVLSLEAAWAIGDEDARTEALKDIAAALVQIQEFDMVLAVAERIENVYTKAEMLIEVAPLIVAAGEKAKAAGIMNRALDIAETVDDWYWRAYILSRAAHAMALSGEKSKAAGIANKALAEAERIKDTYSKAWALGFIAQLILDLGERVSSADIANRMLAAVIEGGYYSVSILSMAAQLMAQLGEKDGLKRILDAALKIEDESEKVEALSEVMQALAITGEQEKALSVAEAINFELWVEPNPLRKVARILAQLEEFDRALAVVEKIHGESEKARALCEIAQVMARLGRRAEAVEIANKALVAAEAIDIDEPFKAEVISEVALTMVQIEEKAKAAEIANRALDVEAASRHSLSWNSISGVPTYQISVSEVCKVAQALAYAGDKVKAAEIANRALVAVAEVIENKETKVNTLNGIAVAMSQVGEKAKAAEIANRALAIAEKIKNDTDKVYSLGSVAATMALLGEKDGLNRVLAASEGIKDVPNESNRTEALNCWRAPAIAQIGDFDMALAIAEKIENRYDKAETLIKIALSMAQSGKRAEAVEIANKALTAAETIDDESLNLKSYALNSIAAAMVQLGDRARAAEITNKALIAAEKIDYETHKAYALIGVAQAMAQLGEKDGLSRVLAAAESIEQRFSKAEALSSVAQAMAQSGEKAKAVEIANKALTVAVESDSFGAQALSSVAEAMAQVGEKDGLNRVLAAAETIEYKHEKAEALGGIAEAIVQAGEFEQAFSIWRDELALVQSAGRDQVFRAIEKGASLIAARDQGHTLWKIYEAIVEIEGWWDTQ